MGVAFGKRKVKAEAGGVDGQPSESGGAREAFFQRRIVGRGEIKGATGVMFAVTRSGDEAEDRVQRATGGKLGPNNPGLAGDAAKAGQRNESEVDSERGAAEFGPRVGGGGSELDGAIVGGERDGDERGGVGFGLEGEAAAGRIISGKAEGAVEFGELERGHVLADGGGGSVGAQAGGPGLAEHRLGDVVVVAWAWWWLGQG